MEKKYPIGGYAPGDYWHKACKTCGDEFTGDKRAWNCELCGEKSEASKIANEPTSPEMDLILKIVSQWGNAVEMPNMEDWLKEYAAQQHGQLDFSIQRGDLWKVRALSAEKKLMEIKAPTGAIWIKGAPKERKQHFAKVLSLLDETPLDAIIEPVLNTTDCWSTCGPGFRFSITEDKIVEHLESATSPTRELTPGAPTTTGTYFAVIKGYINDEPQMCVLHYQAHKNIYKAAGHAFNIEVKAEDVVGYYDK